MSSTSLPSLWNKFFIFCLFNNLFLFIFYFAQTAILPIYIVNELGGSVTQAGLAMTMFLVSSIAVRPFTGLIIEKFGRKKTLLVSEFAFCAFSFVYLFAQDLNSLLIIRFFHGIWFSILTTVCIPVVNDFIPEQRKGEGMGYFVMSINLGLVLGPLIGLSFINSLGYLSITTVLAVIICLGFISCLAIPLPNKDPKPTAAVAAPKAKLSIDNFIERRALPTSLMVMMTAFAYASIMSFISVFAESRELLQYAGAFFLVFAISMISVRPFTGPLYDRKGPNAVVYPAVILFALGLMVLSQIHGLFGFMLAAVLIGIGFGSVQPCLQTLAIQRAPKERIGYTTSTFFTLYDSGIAIGSVVLGFIIGQYGFELMYALCAVVTLLSLVFYKLVVDRQKPLKNMHYKH